MYNKQAFQSGFKGSCGQIGRGKFGGPWGQKSGGFRGRFGGSFGHPPINIAETDSDFLISLFAAGLVKEQVTLTVKDDVLTIAYPGTDPAASGSYTYQEHSQEPFERQFRLNDKVVTEGISATYADGILRVTLPKNPATNTPAQSIMVA